MTVKIAISLPAELLAEAERERAIRRESRSEFFRRAVEAFLDQQRQREAIHLYVQGYLQQPESAQEVAVANAMSVGALTAGQ